MGGMTDVEVARALEEVSEQYRERIQHHFAHLSAELDALRKDAGRYKAVRAMCCSDHGPSQALASAWMVGDESLADMAVDAVVQRQEAEQANVRT